ncbi:MAG: hypothetical protein QOF51_3559 [Chloroflexota bacterium]|jgi:hypothetical protein|nr:hypothetical protein [Chloroflexota bacterium]
MARRRSASEKPQLTAPESAVPPTDSDLNAEIRQRLLDLALDARSYLRRNTQPAVRISAALLLAASLAACNAEPAAPTPPPVAPLTQEVRSGLPTAPGRYNVAADSLQRDAQGVYALRWLDSGQSGGTGHPARISLLRLAEGSSNYLDVPAQGDPTLYLQHDTQIALSNTAGSATPTTQNSGGGGFAYWRPFYLGGGPFLPSYYNPPSQSVPSSTTIDGSRSSSTAPAPSARTVGVSSAVSGRAGGAGSGAAATNKSGASVGSGTGAASATGSVGAAKSGGFSSGGAASGKAGGGSSSSSS